MAQRQTHVRIQPTRYLPTGATLPMERPDAQGRLAGRILQAQGGGQPLGSEVQRTLEAGLGADLSGVRVHTDGQADRLARSVQATAFTTGPDIFFRRGAYNPGTSQGMHLLAHEATHVVQQAAGPVAGTPLSGGVSVSDPGDPFERQAEAIGRQIASPSGTPVQPAPGGDGSPAEREVTPLQRRPAPMRSGGSVIVQRTKYRHRLPPYDVVDIDDRWEQPDPEYWDQVVESDGLELEFGLVTPEYQSAYGIELEGLGEESMEPGFGGPGQFLVIPHVSRPVRATLPNGAPVDILEEQEDLLLVSLFNGQQGAIPRGVLYLMEGQHIRHPTGNVLTVLAIGDDEPLYTLKDLRTGEIVTATHAQVVVALGSQTPALEGPGVSPGAEESVEEGFDEEESGPLYEVGDILTVPGNVRLEILDVGVSDEGVFRYLISPITLGIAEQHVMTEDMLSAMNPIIDPGGRPSDYFAESLGRYHFPTHWPIAQDESRATARKQGAKSAFEAWVTKNELSIERIAEALPKIVADFNLTSIGLTVTDDGLTVAFVASPPDYSHIVPHGGDLTKATTHPASAFTRTKPELVKEEVDSNQATPLGAIMKELGLKDTDVNLLVKGNMTSADRPKSVRATVVGTRRRKGGRVGGAVNPAAIAHLGHHELMILNPDKTKWISYYDGGHLIGDQLMPSTGPDTFVEWNLAPMEQVLNQQSYLTWIENVIRAGGVDTGGDADLKVPISVRVTVSYPDAQYTVTETQLAQSGLIPHDPSNNPLSGKNRTVTIPSRIPYKWQLHAKIGDPSSTFKEKTTASGKKAKSQKVAHTYYDYSDLTTKEIGFQDAHWWTIKGSSKSVTGEISSPVKSQELHFEAYQFYPKR